MNMPIEVIGFFFLFFIFICWLLYKKLSDKMIAKKYNPNDDKSRLGEEAKRARGSDKPITTGFRNVSRLAESPERSSIQAADIEHIRKDSQSFRGFFARRNKK